MCIRDSSIDTSPWGRVPFVESTLAPGLKAPGPLFTSAAVLLIIDWYDSLVAGEGLEDNWGVAIATDSLTTFLLLLLQWVFTYSVIVSR